MLCVEAVDEENDEVGHFSWEESGIYGQGLRVVTLYPVNRAERLGTATYKTGRVLTGPPDSDSWSIDRLVGTGRYLHG